MKPEPIKPIRSVAIGALPFMQDFPVSRALIRDHKQAARI
jgi:hypothetical protein